LEFDNVITSTWWTSMDELRFVQMLKIYQ
jgi:hypothetical protein